MSDLGCRKHRSPVPQEASFSQKRGGVTPLEVCLVRRSPKQSGLILLIGASLITGTPMIDIVNTCVGGLLYAK